MKIFLVLLFVLALSGSSKESALSHKISRRGLSTILKTSFNGTYQRKNPCTNADIEKSSYVSSHEFHHHANENNWNDYTSKFSVIINTFLQAIVNLVRFNSKQNGTFNFHINTSISQKQDGYCESFDEKQCNSLPTISIEADGCELPFPCKSSFDSTEKEQTVIQEEKYLSNQDDEIVKEGRQNTAKITPKAVATLKPILTTRWCPTKDESILASSQDACVKYSTHDVNCGLATEGKLQKDETLIPVNDGSADKNFTPVPGFSGSSIPTGIKEAKNYLEAFSNDFSQNTRKTLKPEQDSKFLGTSPFERDFRRPVLKGEFTTSRKEDQPNAFGVDNPHENPTSFATPVIKQDPIDESSFTTYGTQNFPYYSSPTVLDVEKTRQPYVNGKKLLSDPYEPSQARKQQIFYAMNKEIPDFRINKSLSNLQPSFTSPLTFESKSSQFERPFNYQQPIPARLEKATESLKPDFRAPFSYDGISPSQRFQLADPKTSISSQALDSSVLQSVSNTDKLPLQNQFTEQIYKINKIPHPTSFTAVKQNEEMLGISDSQIFQNMELEKKEHGKAGTTQSDSISTYRNEKEASSDPSQSIQFKELDESVIKSPIVENIFLPTRQTKIPSQNSRFPDYNTKQSLLLTPVVDDAIQLPLIPPSVSTDQISNPEVTFSPESNQENGILYPDRYYDNPITDPFTQIEENYKPFSSTLSPETVNSFTNSFSIPIFESPMKQNADNIINEPVRISDQQPLMSSDVNPSTTTPDSRTIPSLDLKSSSFSHSESLTSFELPVVPKIQSSDLLIDKYETEHQSVGFEVSQSPSSNFGRTYTEDATSVTNNPSLKSKFYNNQSKLEFRENPPLPFPFNSASSKIPSPSQIPPPSALFSGINDNQQFYNNQSILDSNDFQSQSYVASQTPVYIQPSQRPNDEIFSDNDMTSLPPDSVLPKSRTNNAALMEQRNFPEVVPDENLDQIMNIPVPTSYSEQITSDSYTIPVDSSFSKSKMQSFGEINALPTKEPVLPNEQFPDLLPKHSSELPINDSPTNPVEQLPFSPNFYITRIPPKAPFAESSEEISDGFNSKFTEEPHKSKEHAGAFTTYDSQYPKKLGQFQDVLINNKPEPFQEDFLIENQPSVDFKNGVPFSREQPFFNVETAPRSDGNTEEESSYDNNEFQSKIPSNSRNPPAFNKSRGQAQTETFGLIIYPEVSSQSPATVHENQNNEPFFNSKRDHSEQHFSANPAPVGKEKPFFTSNPENLENQNSEFLTFSNEQVADSIAGFEQPSVNYVGGSRSDAIDGRPNHFSFNVKELDQQPESTNFFEPEYQPAVKPMADPEKSGFSNIKNPLGDHRPKETFDRPLILNSERYPTEFLPKTLKSSDPSEPKTRSSLTYNNVQSNVRPPGLTKFNSNHPLRITNPIIENLSDGSSDIEFSQPSFTKAPNQQSTFNSPFSFPRDPKPLNQFSSTAPPTQSFRTIDYPSSPKPPSQSQPPLNYNHEEISGRNKQPFLTTSVHESQLKKLTHTIDLTTAPTADSTAAQGTDEFLNYPEEAITNEAILSSAYQSSSYLTSQEKLPNYSPFLAPFEPQPQPQPSRDNFSNVPVDNIPLSASRALDNSKTNNQYSATSLQDNLRTQGQSNKDSSIPNFNTLPLSYSNRQSSGGFDKIPTPLSVTDIPPFQTLPNSDLKPKEVIIKSNERSQESTGAQETLILPDNVSPQPQPTTEVKYDGVTTQYQTSPVPNPQPQTAQNYANQLSVDNSNGKLPGFFTNQQRLPISDANLYSKVGSASSTTSFTRLTPNADVPNSSFRPENEMIEKLSIKFPNDEIHKQTSEQEIVTTGLPIQMPSQLPGINPNLNLREIFLPQDEQFPFQPLHEKPSFPKSLINLSTVSPQNSNEYFNNETFTPPKSSDREKKQTVDLSQVKQSKILNNNYPEPFIHYNEPPSMISRVPDDISNVRTIPEDYPNQYDYYDWTLRSKDSTNEDPQSSVRPNPEVPSERFFFSDLSPDYKKKEPSAYSVVRPSPQGEPLRFPQRKETDFRLGFPSSLEPNHYFIPGTQLPNFPNTRRKEVITESQAASSYFDPQIPLPPFIPSNNTKGTATTEAAEEVITANLPIAVTESPVQKQLGNSNKILNVDKKFSRFQPFSSSVRENKRFEPSETPYGVHRSPVVDYKYRTFPQYSMNDPQQVKPFFKGNFPLNVSYPNYAPGESANNQQYHDLPFPGKDYADYDQVFPDPPPNQKFEYGEVVSQDSQRMGHKDEPFDRKNSRDVIEKQSGNFQERPLQRPVIYTSDRELSAYRPPPAEGQQHSNPLFQTLESHMTLPFPQGPPSSKRPNYSSSFEPNREKDFLGNSSGSRGWELPNSSLPQPLDIAKPLQSESQPVPHAANPSSNPGEDHVSCCKPPCNEEATSSPLFCPFDTVFKGNMTAPSYYILISKLPIDDNGDEQFQVEKVYRGDGTPFNCSFSPRKLFRLPCSRPNHFQEIPE